jgi:predicted nucleic acid-binding protein
MTILVDTSIWRRFFSGKGALAERLELKQILEGQAIVLTHPAIIGELVLGGLSTREQGLMDRLPLAPLVADDEVLTFVRQQRLARRGIGWVDVHLLASARVARAELWSADRNLSVAAIDLGVGFSG